MKSFLFAVVASASLALGQTTGKLGDAAITENNPSMVAYVATLPTGNGIQGQIEGVSNTNGTGVNFNINFFNFFSFSFALCSRFCYPDWISTKPSLPRRIFVD